MPIDPALVVGLGNPGREYAGHRHNVGAMAVAELADRQGVALRRHKTRAQVAETRLGAPGGHGSRLVLAQPTTFMNESGGAVAGLLAFYSVGVAGLIVVHDDLELPFGEVRAKVGGGEGGHNGLRSLSKSLKTRDYLRIRVGIGRPPGRQDVADFVLRDFSTVERKELPFVVGAAADLVTEVALSGGPGSLAAQGEPR